MVARVALGGPCPHRDAHCHLAQGVDRAVGNRRRHGGAAVLGGSLGGQTEWVTFLAGAGPILLTFLAGGELDPRVFRRKWREAMAIGLVGFFAPFLGVAAIAHYWLEWSVMSSWLAGVALSTTSVAVVYAVMLGVAVWAGSEAVLPAYIVGMVLAGTIGNDHFLVRRLRTVTFGLLTPFSSAPVRSYPCRRSPRRP